MHQEVSYTVDGCRLHVRAVTYVEDFPTTDDSFRGLPRALVRVRPAEAGAIEAISHDVPSSELPRGGDFGTRTELTMSLGLLDASHVTVEHVRSMDVADGTVEAGIDLKWIAFPFAESDAVRAERVAEEFRRAIRLCAGAVEAR